MDRHTISQTDFTRNVPFFDFEANPLDLTGYAARLRVSGPINSAGAGALVIDATTSPHIVITQGNIAYRVMASDALAVGCYEFELDYSLPSGETVVIERALLFVDAAL